MFLILFLKYNMFYPILKTNNNLVNIENKYNFSIFKHYNYFYLINTSFLRLAQLASLINVTGF